jgi:CSLREA domain-containing protein
MLAARLVCLANVRLCLTFFIALVSPERDRHDPDCVKSRSAKNLATVLILTLGWAGRPVLANTLTVTSTADGGGPCPGPACTLRQAILTAAPDDTINFSLPAKSAITLITDELFIDKNLTIDGPGANLLKIERADLSGTPDFRILEIADNVNVMISGLTIAKGSLTDGRSGGGIANFGSLTLTGAALSGNSLTAGGDQSNVAEGSGIFNKGTVTIVNSTINANSATFGGGSGSDVAPDFGGAGGGIYNANTGLLTIVNSTISGNSATCLGSLTHGSIGGDGGGIYNDGTLHMLNVTIAANSASANGGGSRGGGINCDNGTATAKNTIIALNNGSSPDVNGPLTSQGFNFIGNNSSATITPTTGDQIGTPGSPKNPKLGPLQDNGGSTMTQALLAGSTAIDAGNSSGSSTDQRGLTRPADSPAIADPSGGDGSDIGAYEMQVEQLPGCVGINTVVKNNNDSGADSLRQIIANVCTGTTITFAGNVRGAITLTSGELVVDKGVIINGPGADQLTVQRSALTGTSAFRIFNVGNINNNYNTTISGLTIANGKANGGGGVANGGGTLTLDRVTISGNASNSFGGGGVGNLGSISGTLNVIDSAISGNTSASGGGGVFNNNNSTLNLTNSTISGNMVTGNINDGGGIAGGTVTITNSTIARNSVASGPGGGIAVAGNVTARNTIIALNTALSDPDVDGALTSQGHNLVGDGSGATITPAQASDQIGTAAFPIDPHLAALQNNGGSTPTLALLSNSTAINAGNDANAPDLDQRGYVRAGVSDIGAFEFGGTALRITSIVRLTNGHIALQALGVPTELHTIESADGLSAGFGFLARPTADGSGLLSYDDAGALGLTARFYRVTFP